MTPTVRRIVLRRFQAMTNLVIGNMWLGVAFVIANPMGRIGAILLAAFWIGAIPLADWIIRVRNKLW